MRVNVTLILVSILCFALAACATPAETSAAVAAVGASAIALIEQLSPLIPPEKLAKLQATAASIDGTVGAVQTAVGTIADVIAAFKGSVGTQLQAQADAMNKSMQAMAALPSREEVYLVGTGSGAAGTFASRVLSRLKHAAPAKAS